MSLKPLAVLAVVVALLGTQQFAVAQSYAPMGDYSMAGYGYPVAPAAGYMPGNMPGMGLSPVPVMGAPPMLGQNATTDVAGGCSGCGDAACCGDCGGGCRTWIAYGEFLYLQARDAEVAYGVAINGPIAGPPVNPVAVGRVGVVDQDYDPGFRFGVGYMIDGYSGIALEYTMFESGRSDQIDTTAPDVIHSLVSHPGSASAATNFLSANATHDIRYDIIEAAYRSVFSCCDDYEASFLVGLRYIKLTQDFDANFLFTGSESVNTAIGYHGAGVRLGLEGERYLRGGLYGYGKTSASFMVGEFRAAYQQTSSFDPVQVDTSWRAGRIMPILDLELGVGWMSRCGTWRLSAGYLFSGWFNAVKTDDWIQSVRNNNYVDLGDTMTFDGAVARIEGRF